MIKVLFSFLLLFPYNLFSQVLEPALNPTGIVYPRMNTMQRNSLNPDPVEGQCIYNLDHERIECFNGASWDQTSYYSIPTISFLPAKHVDYYGFTTNDGAHFTIAPNPKIAIQSPVHLPEGSIVKKVTYYYKDTDPGTNVYFSYVKKMHVYPVFVQGWAVPSIDTAYGSVSRLVNDTIDNTEFYYFLEMSENPSIVGAGPFMDGDYCIYSAIIEYIK